MIIKKELIKREIAGDTILVPVGKTVFDANGLFVLNEIGAFIWICCRKSAAKRKSAAGSWPSTRFPLKMPPGMWRSLWEN